MKEARHMTLMKLGIPMLLFPGSCFAVIGTETQNMSLTLNSAAKVSTPGSMTLTTSGATFQNYTGTLSINFRARTTQSGSATLTSLASVDFAPGTGPLAASGNLTYTCGAPSLGTGCSGTQTVSTSSQGAVVSVGASACVGTGCASANPATEQVSFALVNLPAYKTGTYTATILLTASAL